MQVGGGVQNAFNLLESAVYLKLYAKHFLMQSSKVSTRVLANL